jgi:hypothetical protein
MKRRLVNSGRRGACAVAVALGMVSMFTASRAQASVLGVSVDQVIFDLYTGGQTGSGSLPPITLTADGVMENVTYTGPVDTSTPTPGLSFVFSYSSNGDDFFALLDYSFTLDAAQTYTLTNTSSDLTSNIAPGSGTLGPGTYSIGESSDFDPSGGFDLEIAATTPEPATVSAVGAGGVMLLLRRRKRD